MGWDNFIFGFCGVFDVGFLYLVVGGGIMGGHCWKQR